MWQNIQLLFVSALITALCPVAAWGYDFFDYHGDRNYRPYAGSEGSHHYSGSLRLQKGMTEDGYYVRAHIEGLRPEDVQIYLRRNRLVLQITQGDKYGLYYPDTRRSSLWQMRFRRQLRLPYDADGTRMTTSTENGIMEIYIPRRSRYMPTDPSLKR
jgi:HSP20 family molecular chaperone IbpA